MQPKLDTASTDVLILCGGKGERLRDLVYDRPKPLAEVNSRPFLDIIIDFTAYHGFQRFVLLAGYMGDLVKEYAKQKAFTTNLEVSCLIEQTTLGTGGALKSVEKLLKSPHFLLLNGDSFCPADLKPFFSYHLEKGALATIMLSRVEEASDYGRVAIDREGRIISFQEKIDDISGALINAGVYMMTKSFLDHLPLGIPCSLEQDVFPTIVGEGLYGYVVQELHFDIGTPERYLKAQDVLHSLIKTK
jgi:NDP-sugar pyrophosphorylase family protein